MQTTIDNNQRVFVIQCKGWSSAHYFCNMADLVSCAQDIPANQPYEISHYWNYGLKRLRKNEVIELLEANQYDATFFKKTPKSLINRKLNQTR